jgi:hypothetical protein
MNYQLNKIYRVNINKLLPTQAVVGQLEVNHKIAALESMGQEKQRNYMLAHIAPVVIDHKGKLHLVDHHHLARAILQSKLRNTMYIQIIQDMSWMGEVMFLKEMAKKNYLYLKTKNGKDMDYYDLPKSFKKLEDDPYRSLAWMVRENNGFCKIMVPFSEFVWANFFRNRINISKKDLHLKKALKKAIKLAKSKAAADLPGYIGNL